MASALTQGLDWEALGAESSSALDAAHAVLVTGNDPVAAARAAIGLGRAQARTRRVAIGDLVGEVEPLQRLVTGDDPHGIVLSTGADTGHQAQPGGNRRANELTE